jgi:ferredoxin
MKIKVDQSLCQAHGDCAIEAPSVFELGDDDDVVRVIDESPSDDRREAVERAARRCPVSAILIES